MTIFIFIWFYYFNTWAKLSRVDGEFARIGGRGECGHSRAVHSGQEFAKAVQNRELVAARRRHDALFSLFALLFFDQRDQVRSAIHVVGLARRELAQARFEQAVLTDSEEAS